MYNQSSHIKESKPLELTSRNKRKKARSVENTMLSQCDKNNSHSAESQPPSAPAVVSRTASILQLRQQDKSTLSSWAVRIQLLLLLKTDC